MPRTPVRLLLAWVTLFALYLLFAGQASRAEVCAAVLAALVGIGLQLYVRLRSERIIRLAAPWLTLAGRVGASLLHDTVLVGGALARAAGGGAVRGRTQPQAFDQGGDAPEAAGRRALVTLAASGRSQSVVQLQVLVCCAYQGPTCRSSRMPLTSVPLDATSGLFL